jgi:hypothetical protein
MPARVLVVANRTACTPALKEAVRARAERGDADFHLVVPATQRGLHRVVDPEDQDRAEVERRLAEGIEALSEAAGTEVTGEVGDHEPLAAIQDAVNLHGADEIIISTLPARVSRWLHLDLVSKAGGLGVPVTHVEAVEVPA